ncbi:MAG: AAA family ATPase [Candidatus Paceibacterota bacterium]|jgi:wobble nucleotide-excising tRNase
MKIARIKEIKNIGTFSNFTNGASLGFEKLTFIYGFNTYGKTTLTDIFQSLKDNDPKIIQDRKTIPAQTGQQKVVFSVKEEIENDIMFEHDNWTQNDLSKYLEVFDTDFIHKNLFTGLNIGRENKENFTQFILGEQSVKLAKEIAKKKKETGDKKRELKTKVPNFVKDKIDIEIIKFLEFSIVGLEKDNIENILPQKKIALQKEQERLKEPQKISQLQEPNEFYLPTFTIIELLEMINTLLQEDYSSIKEDILVKLNKHLFDNFSSKDNAENWIKAGLHYCKDRTKDGCPFCGQFLHNAQDLINIYDSYFDEVYNDFISRIDKELESKNREIENFTFAQKTILQTVLIGFNKYKEFISDEIFQAKLIELQTNIDLLQEEDLSVEKGKILKNIESSQDLKSKCPYKRVDIIDFSHFKTIYLEYNQSLINIKEIIDELSVKIKAFKKQYENIVTIQQGVDFLISEIEELEYKKARIDQDQDCINYIKIQQEITISEAEISVLESRLEGDQSQYLVNYFTQINDLFKKLGSKNFTLEKDTNNQGHMPVYSLKVKFHNVKISNDQLKSVFSESDRRTLALAIFWVKIDLKEQAEKEKMVIILDDPMTSFDDNRTTYSINLFKETISQVSQIIILTHYPNFIKRFCEITKDSQITTKYLKIKKDDATSSLVLSERNVYTMSDYEKVFMKIYEFINRSQSESIKTDLRPFLENLYLPTIFAKQIQDKKVDCSSLEKMIDGIFEGKEEVKTKLHGFRNNLNSDSHIFTSNNDEDVRNFATEMMDYLYSLNY